jgi:3-oxoacyl-(acyl-carrier-protein) synthase III
VNALSGPSPLGILGVGSHLPLDVVSNQVVARLATTTPEWIVGKTGIHSRRRAAREEATSDLAAAAAKNALAAAGITADQIGLIVVATSTPDHPQPPTACLVQQQIGASGAVAFDVNAVCAGFVFALVTAQRMLSGTPPGALRHGLVIGADIYSRIINREDRRTAVLFGDGAGAVVLGPVKPGRGILASDLSSRGDLHHLIRVPAGGSRMPASEESLRNGLHFFQMEGRAVRDFVLTELPSAMRRLLLTHGVDPSDIRHFIPHQANGALLEEAFPLLGLPAAWMHLATLAEFGNTGAASIPIALDAAWRENALQDADLLVMAGFGGGMSLGLALVRWDGGTAQRPC